MISRFPFFFSTVNKVRSPALKLRHFAPRSARPLAGARLQLLSLSLGFSKRSLTSCSFLMPCNSQLASIGVVGAGQMGIGIGIVANNIAGMSVKMIDVNEKILSGSKKFVESWSTKEVAKKKMTPEQQQNIFKNFSYSTKLEDLKQVDIVVEVKTSWPSPLRQTLRE